MIVKNCHEVGWRGKYKPFPGLRQYTWYPSKCTGCASFPIFFTKWFLEYGPEAIRQLGMQAVRRWVQANPDHDKEYVTLARESPNLLRVWSEAFKNHVPCFLQSWPGLYSVCARGYWEYGWSWFYILDHYALRAVGWHPALPAGIFGVTLSSRASLKKGVMTLTYIYVYVSMRAWTPVREGSVFLTLLQSFVLLRVSQWTKIWCLAVELDIFALRCHPCCISTGDESHLTPCDLLHLWNCAINLYFMAVTKIVRTGKWNRKCRDHKLMTLYKH